MGRREAAHRALRCGHGQGGVPSYVNQESQAYPSPARLMLHFYITTANRLPTIASHGLEPSLTEEVWTTLDDAQAACHERGPEARLLIIDALAWSDAAGGALPDLGAGPVVPVPAAAICNAQPYRAPRPVAAAGGYVVRPGRVGPEVLVIYRRGVWDLPKGKVEPGEEVAACALREVREEVGIDDLRLRRPAGRTVHGYVDGDAYCVKTTHWFIMETSETEFFPQHEEDIEAVRWMEWNEARRRVGYRTLRTHMDRLQAGDLLGAGDGPADVGEGPPRGA